MGRNFGMTGSDIYKPARQPSVLREYLPLLLCALGMLVLSLALSGCGSYDRLAASVKGFERTCVDGVLYLQFTSGASVAYDENGKVRKCK